MKQLKETVSGVRRQFRLFMKYRFLISRNFVVNVFFENSFKLYQPGVYKFYMATFVKNAPRLCEPQKNLNKTKIFINTEEVTGPI